MENMVTMNKDFWLNKKVLITGHTGFKGSWLLVWLNLLGADVYGLSLSPLNGRSLFKEIQIPFMKHCPPERKNFLSYSYVLHKFCELLEYDNLLCYFSLLKSREKLQEQDKIWKKICEKLGWHFIKSI